MIKRTIIDASSKNSISALRDILSKALLPIVKSGRSVVFLCIGTDRSTGDCLGPLVGEKLKFLTRTNISLYGNLEKPVHAKNLNDVIQEINSSFDDPFIVAIDACLGSIQNVGKVVIQDKPVSPGSAVNKCLPQIGNISITGIVNLSGNMEFMILQNTRLYTVMLLAEVISSGIYHCILKTFGGKVNSMVLEKQLFEKSETN